MSFPAGESGLSNSPHATQILAWVRSQTNVLWTFRDESVGGPRPTAIGGVGGKKREKEQRSLKAWPSLCISVMWPIQLHLRV